MTNVDSFNTGIQPTWCKGCGNWAIWTGLKNALKAEGIEPWQLVLVAGIGCHGHIINYTEVNCFEGLHGRPLPVGRGIKLANPKLQVIISTGDGDCLGEGGNHFIHTARGNHDLTVLIHNNQVYGLTTGQTSPTSLTGFPTKSTPGGVTEEPINPAGLAILSGATYVARAFAGDVVQLTSLVVGAIKHQGFSVVDILQPCVTFNKLNTYQYFYDRVYKLEDENYQATNKIGALTKALIWGEPRASGGLGIPTGLFYQEKKPAFHQQLPQLEKQSLVAEPIKPQDVSDLLAALI